MRKSLIVATCIAIICMLVTSLVFIGSTSNCSSSKHDSLAVTQAISTSVAPISREGREVNTANDYIRLKAKLSRLQNAYARTFSLKPHPDAGQLVTPTGGCNLDFANPEGREGRPRVAISLVLIQKDEFIRDALPSLIASDIMEEADVAIFVWYNLQNSAAHRYMKTVTGIPIVEVPNAAGNNSGIVIPRIRVMDAMLAHGCDFQWFLEMHDDMYFFSPWFKQLLAHDKPHYGILMPFVVNGIATIDKVQATIRKYSQNLTEDTNVVYERCVQVHPWLLKREFIEDVGYFNPVFSPHIGEDDDLYIRTLRAGWVPAAIRTSWVLHRGGMTRGSHLPRETDSVRKFQALHGVGISVVKESMLNHRCHPVIAASGDPSFPLQSAPLRTNF